MNDYIIKVVDEFGSQIHETTGPGANAYEALEMALSSAVMQLFSDTPVEAHVATSSGYAFVIPLYRVF